MSEGMGVADDGGPDSKGLGDGIAGNSSSVSGVSDTGHGSPGISNPGYTGIQRDDDSHSTKDIPNYTTEVTVELGLFGLGIRTTKKITIAGVPVSQIQLSTIFQNLPSFVNGFPDSMVVAPIADIIVSSLQYGGSAAALGAAMFCSALEDSGMTAGMLVGLSLTMAVDATFRMHTAIETLSFGHTMNKTNEANSKK